jgi:7,8-dihydropterin-6-yl-methyl-4-(beta-D-ribofuranosyl)aminobenzene 5'-phosphate synthase
MADDAITILHDSFGADRRLSKNWGFSAWVEFGGRRILFDTGNDEAVFASNLRSIGVALADLDAVVISHRHGDHTTGLAHVLRSNSRVPVWVPKETYGVFGSSLPGTFYPRCPVLPLERRYYDGMPPELIRHGSPWDADFRHVDRTMEIAPGVVVLHTVSQVKGTLEMPELTLSLRTDEGQVIVAGCSHPGIAAILAGASTSTIPVLCIFGGLHWVLNPPEEAERLAASLKDEWRVRRIAPGHCTGEPGFDALQRRFGDDYLYAGLGSRIPI